MGFLDALYRVVMRRNAVYVTFVVAGAFAGERVRPLSLPFFPDHQIPDLPFPLPKWLSLRFLIGYLSFVGGGLRRSQDLGDEQPRGNISLPSFPFPLLFHSYQYAAIVNGQLAKQILAVLMMKHLFDLIGSGLRPFARECRSFSVCD
jgi:hypothetical protein